MASSTTLQQKHNMDLEESSHYEEIRKEMHQAIDAKNYRRVQHCLQRAQDLKLWLHPDSDESAMHKAIKSRAFKVYGLLMSHGCDFKHQTERECFEGLNWLQRAELQRQRFFVTKDEGSYVNHLKDRIDCHPGQDSFRAKAEQMLEELDRIELVRPILQVVATSPHLKIRFDFDRGDVQPLMGCCGRYNRGLTDYEKEEIFIAANPEGFTDARRDAEVLGTLAHELCHFALHLVYRNEGTPYRRPDTMRRRRYQNIIASTKDIKGLDEIIMLAFQYGNPTEKELIVRIPHILALHGSPGEGDTILLSQAPELLAFYKEFVTSDVPRYIQRTCPSKDVENIKIENARQEIAEKTDKLNVKFQKTIKPEDLGDVPLLIVSGPEVSLLEILVHDAVKSTGELYLFFKASRWDDTLRDVLIENKCNFVLLACNDKTKTRTALSLLNDVSETVGTRIILLVPEEDKDYFLEEAQQGSYFADNHLAARVPEARFHNISPECFDKVWRTCYIRFTGRDHRVPIINITNLESFKEFMNTTAFLILCESKLIEIGPPVPKLQRDISAYYINRRLERAVDVDVERISSNSTREAFAFCGCSVDTVSASFPSDVKVYKMKDLTEFETLVVLEDIDDYELLTNDGRYKGKTVHLLEYDASREAFVWIKSNGPLSHIPWGKSKMHSQDELLKPREEAVVVCGEPGIGKSALAYRIFREIDEKIENHWVLYIDLAKNIQRVEAKSNGGDAQQLALLCGVKTEGPEFALLQHSVQHGNPFRVVFIFDGFDEIDEDNRQYILELVQHLRSQQTSKIFLLSRGVFKTSIQDALHTVSFDLLPFSSDDLVTFLERYWKANGVSDEKLRRFAKGVFKKYVAVVGNSTRPLDNPLLIRMVAELEEPNISLGEYSGDIQSSDEENITLFHIYKRFVDYKHDIYAKEKMNLDLKTAPRDLKHAYELSKKEFQRRLCLVAVNVIFGSCQQKKILTQNELEELKPEGELMKEVAESGLGYGLLDGLHEGLPAFIHQTFAEFFAAQYLYNNAKRNETPALVEQILKMYTQGDFQRVTLFFDSFAAASSLIHSFIIGGNVSSIRSHLTLEKMNTVDEFSRTPLHIATLYAEPDILKMMTDMMNILPKNERLSQKDIFGMTPLMYADKRQTWKSLDILCGWYSDANIAWAEEIPTAVRDIRSTVFEVAKGNFCSLLSVLLSQCCRTRRECRLGRNPHLIDLDTITAMEMPVLFFARSVAVLELLLPYCSTSLRSERGRTPFIHGMFEEFPHLRLYLRDRCYTRPHDVNIGQNVFETLEFRFLHLPVDIPDEMERTPLNMCVRLGQSELVKLLLLRSRTNVEDWCCRTPLDLAYGYGDLDVIKLLLPHSTLYYPKHLFSEESRFDWCMNETVFRLDFYRENVSSVSVSLYYSPEKMCQIMSNVRERDTYQKAFQDFFPYLNIEARKALEGNLRGLVDSVNYTNANRHFRPYNVLVYDLQDRRDVWSRLATPVVLKQLIPLIDGSPTCQCRLILIHPSFNHNDLDAVKLLLPHSNLSARNKEGMRAHERALHSNKDNHEQIQMLRRWTTERTFVHVHYLNTGRHQGSPIAKK
ncbi:uncharacterized protein LOC135370394 [Ornithodoros turicata]|uniref:uncharacterized protein LOC135370394 n=1 Tax=Ornithodoros turicata TaxID=34597 RepID=UPI003138E163